MKQCSEQKTKFSFLILLHKWNAKNYFNPDRSGVDLAKTFLIWQFFHKKGLLDDYELAFWVQ